MKKIGILIIAAIVLVGLILLKPKNKNGNAHKAMHRGGGKAVVDAYIVKPETLDNNVYATGNVMANEAIELKPEVGGRIVYINIDEGAKVSKGDLLIKLDDADLQAQLKKERATEQLDSLTEYRQRKLLKINGISQQDYDVALNNLKSVKADISMTLAQIAKTELKAPFNGIVGLKNVSLGSYVSPSTDIASLVQIEPVKIDFTIPERYMNEVFKGAPIDFKIPDANKMYHGKIYAVDPQINIATRTVHVRAIAPNKNDKVLPGAFVQVWLRLKKIDSALLVPSQAIIPVLNGQKIYTVEKGKAVEHSIITGMRLDSAVQVVKGINISDSVIINGVMSIHPGASVQVESVK